ncbi:MAG: iron-sulfur cluster repair protein YtfE [Deltaproteobacteria bacterium]|nr:iron-sulfur cluster repair protein YtfE [Deltaproteobacteria bacterium]
MTMIDCNETLGNLATAHPAATSVFLRHRLDFCCGGGQKLDEACRNAGIDPAVVAAEITAQSAGVDDGPQRWDTRPVPELIDHILTRYHEPLRKDLPALVEAAKKVERVHGAKPTCPRGLAEHLELVHAEVGNHLAKEEQMLFPALRSGNRGQTVHMPIRVMMQEHEDHGVNLKRIREITSDFALPAEACGTWRALYAGLEKLESELMEHIHLENNVLFPRALND